MRSETNLATDEAHKEADFTYISGPKYFFQRFVRQYPVAALAVWVGLFLVELAMLVLYIVQSTMSVDVSWKSYDQSTHSGWFYARFVLSVVSLSQLFFAYSLSVMTITVVVATSIYQIVLFFVSLDPKLAWVSKIYVPFFLRCWPLRQYFLFILDSVALMTTRNRKLDLLRLAAGPLTLFICMVVTATGIFRIDQTFRGFPVNFGVSLYFVIVTVSTVGFGDVVPKTPEGRAITIVMIFIFIAKMPTFIQVIRSTAKILKAYRAYTGRKNHFIVYGLVTREEAISILDEVFCLYPMKSVCFCNKEFADDVKSIGRHPTYRLRSTFLLVDTLDSFSLKRMKADDAAAVIIVPVREGFSSRVDDDVMLSSLIFERLLPELPQYVWLRYGLHIKLLKGQRASVIDEHTKKNIMATALLLPGIIPFLVNITRTAWASGTEPPNLWEESSVNNWKHLYEYSRRNVISSCPVPARFVRRPLSEVIQEFKYCDVLVVGVEESARKILLLQTNYIVEEEDVLIAIYERHRNSLAKALEVFSQGGSGPGAHSADYGSNYRHDISEEVLMQQNMNASFVFYPYARATEDEPVDTGSDDAAAAAAAGVPHHRATESFPVEDERAAQNVDERAGEAITEAEVKKTLLELDFVVKNPRNIALESLELGPKNATRLNNLIVRLNEAFDNPHLTEEEKTEVIAYLENQINVAVIEIADTESAARLGDTEEREKQKEQEEVFLFIDQTTSILRKTSTSIYEDVISQTIAQYELYVMMYCLNCIHAGSSLTLLTLRKYPPEFFKAWESIFGSPVKCIRGQGSLDSHLNYALNSGGGISKVRGILLYCSQMGPRDFGDVPIFSVENSVRELLEWNERLREEAGEVSEQNIVIELQSLASSIKIAPFHSDSAWRERGENNFQDTLTFMMGRCFSSNMLLTLMIHAHRDYRIVSFFEMVLNLSSTAEMFDMAAWGKRAADSQTMFRLCGNHTLQFEKFGDAFEFLLQKRRCVAIGVFRLFPESEMLGGSPRYFVTNPPMQMPLLVDDIVYCLDGSINAAR